MQDVSIRELLIELGYPDGVLEAALARLLSAGLTRPGKERIATAKRHRVEELLQERYFLHCNREVCRQAAHSSHREGVLARTDSACHSCGGRPNARALEEVAELLVRHGDSRLVVVLAASELQHRVSDLYKPARASDPALAPVVTVPGRSVEKLCEAVRRYFGVEQR